MGVDLTQTRAVIFDLDGTLVHTLGDFQMALHRTMADLGLPPVTNTQIEQTIGKGSEHLIRTLLAYQVKRPEVIGTGQACPALTVEALYGRAWALYQDHYRQINGHFSQVYPGAREALEALQSKGLPMACLTNKPLAFALTLLREKSLNGFFTQVFGGDSFAQKKPHPMPVLKACEALATPVENSLMVGDSSNDAHAAHAAGCPVVLVTYGYNHGHAVQDTPASAWLDTLADLPRHLSAAGI